jgi:hypothetical protein
MYQSTEHPIPELSSNDIEPVFLTKEVNNKLGKLVDKTLLLVIG